VAVYGPPAKAKRVAVVVSNDASGPDVINGDWQLAPPAELPTGVHYDADQTYSDASNTAGTALSGYASPVVQVPPASDADGDGVPDATDHCPAQPGPSSNSGCPTTAARPIINTAQNADGGLRVSFAPPHTSNSVEGYAYDLSTDGGTTVGWTYSESGTSTPLTSLTCPVADCTGVSVRIRAQYAATQSADSNWVKVAPIAAPKLAAVRDGDHGLVAFFTPAPRATYQTPRGYTYDISTDGGTTLGWSYHTSRIRTPLTVLVCPVADCTGLSVRIRAYYDTANSKNSGWVTIPPIAAPTLRTVQNGSGGTRVYFTPVTTPSYLTPRGYTYDFSVNDGTTVDWSARTSQTASPLTGLTCPATDCTGRSVRIRADYDTGQSSSSAWATVPPPS
jgi:hypothetical protein